jgi:hypothetical protein
MSVHNVNSGDSIKSSNAWALAFPDITWRSRKKEEFNQKSEVSKVKSGKNSKMQNSAKPSSELKLDDDKLITLITQRNGTFLCKS